MRLAELELEPLQSSESETENNFDKFKGSNFIDNNHSQAQPSSQPSQPKSSQLITGSSNLDPVVVVDDSETFFSQPLLKKKSIKSM